jgi:hypothetical protein
MPTPEEQAWLHSIHQADMLSVEFAASGFTHSAEAMRDVAQQCREGLAGLREFRKHQPKPL